MVLRRQSKQTVIFLVLCCAFSAASAQSPAGWREALKGGSGFETDAAVQAARLILPYLAQQAGVRWPAKISPGLIEVPGLDA